MKMYSFPSTTTPNNGWTYWPSGTPQPYWNTLDSYWYNCPKCNKLVQWGSVFCSSCGHKLIQEETDVERFEKLLQEVHEKIDLIEKQNGELEELIRGLQGSANK